MCVRAGQISLLCACVQWAALRELLPPGIVCRLAAVEHVACRLPVQYRACWPFVCPSFLLSRLPRCFDPTCVTPAPQDPHSLPEGSEPCVVLAQLGYVPDFGIDKRPRPVREYVHAASPATAGSSSFAAAKASSGGKGDGVGRQQQQEQRQQLTNDLRTFISESLDEDGYVKLLCMSCEVGLPDCRANFNSSGHFYRRWHLTKTVSCCAACGCA